MRDKELMNETQIRAAIQYAIGKVKPEQLRRYFKNAYNPQEMQKPKRRKVLRQPSKKYKKTPI